MNRFHAQRQSTFGGPHLMYFEPSLRLLNHAAAVFRASDHVMSTAFYGVCSKGMAGPV